MGGSLALALRPYLEHLVVVDTDPVALDAAANIADQATAQFDAVAKEAEFLILATPVRTIIDLLARLPGTRQEGCLVLDLGSTKAAINRAMSVLPHRFQAMGGHPMCGKESGGFGAASGDLFRNQTFVLCRNSRTGPGIEELTLEVIELIGASPLFLEADGHDSLVAVTSHLPYLVAAGLVRAAATVGDERVWQVSASGFHDTSRLSGSDPRMMLDILMTNGPAILAQLEKHQEELADVARWLRLKDERRLEQWLAQAHADHEQYRAVRKKL
jgi:prephenate dehydrogenase